MSIANPFATKTAGVSPLTAAEVNAAGVAHTKSVDGVGGGTYTNAAKLEFNGSYGLEVGAPFVLDAPSDQAAQIDSPVAPASGTRRLLHRARVDGAAGGLWVRTYCSFDGETGLEIAVNCSWTGTQWTRDNASLRCVLTTFAASGVIVQHKLGVVAWSTWDNNPMRVSGADVPMPVAPTANTLYGPLVPRAWGVVTTTGTGGASGDITVVDGFNLTAAKSFSSGAVRLTLATPMASSNYVVTANNDLASANVARARAISASQFDLMTVVGNTGATHDATANLTRISFVAFGRQ